LLLTPEAVYYLIFQPIYNTFAVISCISSFKSNFKSGKIPLAKAVQPAQIGGRGGVEPPARNRSPTLKPPYPHGRDGEFLIPK
jgi:hypothetical protein